MQRQTNHMKLLSVVILGMQLVCVRTGFAETISAIFGVITDGYSGELLTEVNLVVVGTDFSTITDKSGTYRFENLPVGKYEIKISKVGYKPKILPLKVHSNKKTKLNVQLEMGTFFLSEVVVSAQRLAEKSCVSDHIIADRKQLLLKEGHMQDPIRVILTMPGITSTGDLFSPSQLYVRGGEPNENLFMVDWVTLHWPWYWGGMKSTLNSETIEKIELLTGGFPVKYGNCLSSVLNVTTREGNRERFCGNVSLGFINTQALFEGPLSKKSSFLFAARRTYFDLVMSKESEAFPVTNFYDFNLKLGYDITEKHKIFFSGFSGNEKIDFYTSNPDPGVPQKIYDEGKWNTQSVELKSQFGENVYSVFALTRENLNFHVEVGKTEKMDIDTCDYRIIEDLTLKVHPNHELKTGFKITDVNFDFEGKYPHPENPNVDPNDATVKLLSVLAKLKTNSAGTYFQDSWTLTQKLSLTGGMRSDYLEYNKKSDISPRLALKYDLNDETSLRAACGNYTQTPELEELSKNSTLDSKKAVHYICGISRKFSKNLRSWSEVYYKDYRDLITVDTLGNYSNSGKGYARGIEFFLEKKVGDIAGWISYSFSESKRLDSAEKKEYLSNFDQPHLLSIMFDCNLVKNIIANLHFRVASGRPYTSIITAQKNSTTGVWEPIWDEKNSARYEPFHQLNLRIVRKFKIGKLNAESYFEVWNLYSQKNIMGYIYQYGDTYENNVKGIPYYSMPFMPGGGFKIEF
ncbi:MAG: TonB-dependent receptor [Elusimicrobiota bacterium]